METGNHDVGDNGERLPAQQEIVHVAEKHVAGNARHYDFRAIRIFLISQDKTRVDCRSLKVPSQQTGELSHVVEFEVVLSWFAGSHLITVSFSENCKTKLRVVRTVEGSSA